MVALRALQRRVTTLEQAGKPRPSPLVRWYGSFDNFVATAIRPSICTGALAQDDMCDIVEVLRSWEADGTWSRPA